jgi:(R)-2-hydroxyacyl-CoA dehydratese activating ATPase
MICAGIDAGSRALKIVLFDGQRAEDGMVGSLVHDQGVDHNKLAETGLADLLAQCRLKRENVARIIATGYGRNLIKMADSTVTEITCHAVGVRHVVPGDVGAMTVVEIGGQDSKLLRLDGAAGGMVRDFAMNDRCAAGTGQFLEMVARRLEVPLAQLGEMARRAKAPAAISSTCVVFAETEIIGLLASGMGREEIVAGVQQSIAQRIGAMAGGRVDEPVYFTGGVALVPGMREALEGVLQKPVTIVPRPQITGALGAAILAARTAN